MVLSATTCTRVFHDIEYTISIQECEGLDVEARTGSQTWRAQFSPSFIEEVSRRAGNVKTFPVFYKMLVAALLEESSSVHIDVLTTQDLTQLRQRDMPSADGPNKRYLILTYQAEFDKVHYPLALQPVAEETIDSLREQVQQLEAQLQQTNTDDIEELREENERLRSELREVELARNSRGNRRESAELTHSKQTLTKYQNELKTLRDTKQRLIIDHRKEMEELRKEITQGKSDVRRLEAQLNKKRGESPSRSRAPLASSRSSSSSRNPSYSRASASPSSRSISRRPSIPTPSPTRPPSVGRLSSRRSSDVSPRPVAQTRGNSARRHSFADGSPRPAPAPTRGTSARRSFMDGSRSPRNSRGAPARSHSFASEGSPRPAPRGTSARRGSFACDESPRPASASRYRVPSPQCGARPARPSSASRQRSARSPSPHCGARPARPSSASRQRSARSPSPSMRTCPSPYASGSPTASKAHIKTEPRRLVASPQHDRVAKPAMDVDSRLAALQNFLRKNTGE